MCSVEFCLFSRFSGICAEGFLHCDNWIMNLSVGSALMNFVLVVMDIVFSRDTFLQNIVVYVW